MAWQRKTPFGYMVRDGETVPNPMEADAVRSIFTSYLAGASYWFLGHYHRNCVVDDRFIIQWEQMVGLQWE